MAVSKHAEILSLVCIIATLCISVRCQPIKSNAFDTATGGRNRLQLTEFKSFDEVADFLRSWFNILRTRLQRNDSREESRDLQSRLKRDTAYSMSQEEKPAIVVDLKGSNETSFEDYERLYLINQTMILLEQIYYYSDYRSQHREHNGAENNGEAYPTAQPIDTTSSENSESRASAILEAKLNELLHMPTSDLEKIFHNVRRAAEDGVTDPGIASICCQMG